MALRLLKSPSQRLGTPANWLIVGLGNPGSEYVGTRHNVGAEVIVSLAQGHGVRLKAGKERARVAEMRIGDSLVVLACPQTFMNLSGESVRLLVKRYGIADLARLVVVHDELDLPNGRMKLKSGGGLAGHNGLKSLFAHLHSGEFTRLRIGIGRPPGQQQVADYVLHRPSKLDRVELDVAVATAVDVLERIVADGFERTMNDVNANV